MFLSDERAQEQQEELRRKNAEVDRLLTLDKFSYTQSSGGNASKFNRPVMLVLGAGIFLWAASVLVGHFLQQGQLARAGATTKGMVIATSRARASSIAEYNYRVGEKPYTGTSYYYAGPDASSSNAVTVRYLPSDPRQSEIVGRENYMSKILWCVFGIVMGGGVFASALLPKTPDKKTAEILYDPAEPIEGPEWASKPYRSMVSAKSAQTDPVSVDDSRLHPLPTDKKP